MHERSDFLVDFVARGSTPDEWRMVLVEEGPWTPPFDDELRRIQTRLYECVDAALDGQIASKFPESRGKRLVVQLDGYQLPNKEVDSFFRRFAAAALAVEDYRRALASCPYVSEVAFELNLNDGAASL
jgi:hypothetical protein